MHKWCTCVHLWSRWTKGSKERVRGDRYPTRWLAWVGSVSDTSPSLFSSSRERATSTCELVIDFLAFCTVKTPCGPSPFFRSPSVGRPSVFEFLIRNRLYMCYVVGNLLTRSLDCMQFSFLLLAIRLQWASLMLAPRLNLASTDTKVASRQSDPVQSSARSTTSPSPR